MVVQLHIGSLDAVLLLLERGRYIAASSLVESQVILNRPYVVLDVLSNDGFLLIGQGLLFDWVKFKIAKRRHLDCRSVLMVAELIIASPFDAVLLLERRRC